MISRFMGSSAMLGSVLTAQSLETTLDSVSLAVCPSPAHVPVLFLSLSLSKINQHLKKINKRKKKEGKGEVHVEWGGEGRLL